jgi:uncharacterized protein YcfL
MRHLSFLRFFTLPALLFILAGCATVNTVEPANPEARPNYVNDKQIITDPSLRDIARIKSVYFAAVGGGDIKRIQVNVQNITSGVKNFNYQFQWFDNQGMAITTPAPIWHSVSIEGGQSLPLTETAPSPQAVDWRLSLLESVRR